MLGMIRAYEMSVVRLVSGRGERCVGSEASYCGLLRNGEILGLH